jgi:hypothetical protein
MGGGWLWKVTQMQTLCYFLWLESWHEHQTTKRSVGRRHSPQELLKTALVPTLERLAQALAETAWPVIFVSLT